LKKNGYQTAGFVNNSQVGDLVGLNRGHEDFYEIWQGVSKNQVARRALHKLKDVAGFADHGAAKTNMLIMDWLKKRDARRPFYLFAHYIDAHNPLKAPYPYRFQYLTETLKKQVDMNKIWQIADNPLLCLSDNLTLNDREIEALIALYDEEINYLDAKIGELIDWLKTENIFHNTLFILTADHGEHWGEQGLYSHVASLREPITHIPLIVHYPEVFRVSTEVEGFAQLVDVMPTVLEAAMIADDSSIRQGKSLFRTNAIARHPFVIAEWEGRVPYFIQNRSKKNGESRVPEFVSQKQAMIREGDFKLISREDGALKLYNLKEDPDENRNLAAEKRDLAASLKEKLDKHIQKIQQKSDDESYQLTEQVLKNLKDLGYM